MNIYSLFKKRKATHQELTPVEIQPPYPTKKNHPENSEWFFVS
jgi:hypothetical protein